MKVAVFLKILLSVGFVFCCSTPVHAGAPKAFDKYDPPSDLILTLPDQWPAAKKLSQSSGQGMVTNNNNETQTSALKRTPVNMDCGLDVIQNTLGDVPLTNRIFGECGLHYHY